MWRVKATEVRLNGKSYYQGQPITPPEDSVFRWKLKGLIEWHDPEISPAAEPTMKKKSSGRTQTKGNRKNDLETAEKAPDPTPEDGEPKE